MTEPQTEAGMRLLRGIDLPDGRRVAPPVADIARIEAESRNATLDEVVRAVEGLRRGEANVARETGRPMDSIAYSRACAAVLEAIQQQRRQP